MPAYNCVEYISQAIDSVQAQTYENWELLVVDNMSTDGTTEIVKSYDDSRIKLSNIRNQGIIARSRNQALKQCVGEWLSFLDADDYWDKQKLQRCLDEALLGFDVVYHPMTILRSKPQIYSRKRTKCWQVKSPVFTEFLTRGNPIVNSSVFLRSAVLMKAGLMAEDTDLVTAEDFNTWISVSALTNKFRFLNICLGTYRIHQSNASESVDRTIPLGQVINRYIKLLSPRDQDKAMALLAYLRGKSEYEKRNYREAIREFRNAFLDVHASMKVPCAFFYMGSLAKSLAAL
jgi:glycosyltransferase involved in cell wall biosynthesis